MSNDAPATDAKSGIRPATPGDGAAIGRLQQTQLRALLTRIGGGDLGPEVASTLDGTDFEALWEAAIKEPPSPAHHVLVLAHGEEIAGFAALEPSPEVAGFAQITALIGAGGPERDLLINAVADITRAAAARGLTMWALGGDDDLTEVLAGAGFAPSGQSRELMIGASNAREHLWWASFAPTPDVTP